MIQRVIGDGLGQRNLENTDLAQRLNKQESKRSKNKITRSEVGVRILSNILTLS